MTRFAIDTMSLHGVGMASAVTLRGLGGGSHRLTRNTAGPGSGNTYDEARFILDTDDEFAFSGMLALKSLLDNISPLIGKCVTDDETHPGVILYGQSLDRCGTKGRGGTGTHASIAAKLAHLMITDIGGSKNQFATATVRGVNLLKSGETRPTVSAYNVSLPSTVVADEAFKIGPIEIGDIVLTDDEIVSLQVELGHQVEVVKNTKGKATNLLVLKSMPRLRITVEDGSILADAKIPYGGKAALHADTVVSFIALDPAGDNKALDGAHHIKITANGKAYIEEHMAGGGAATASNSLVVETTETSGGTAPLVVTTGVALE